MQIIIMMQGENFHLPPGRLTPMRAVLMMRMGVYVDPHCVDTADRSSDKKDVGERPQASLGKHRSVYDTVSMP